MFFLTISLERSNVRGETVGLIAISHRSRYSANVVFFLIDIAALLTLGDYCGRLGLRFTPALGFELVPFALPLPGLILALKDCPPIALAAFDN